MDKRVAIVEDLLKGWLSEPSTEESRREFAEVIVAELEKAKVSGKAKANCPYCHGTGRVPCDEGAAGPKYEDCTYCKGTGKVDGDDPLAGPGGHDGH